MSHDEDAERAGQAETPGEAKEQSYPCPYCGTEQTEPREPMFGGGLSGRHQCFCVWEDQANGPLVCVAIGICCHRTGPGGLTEHHRQGRRWQRLKSPRPVDWDEVASCVASTKRVEGDLWQQAGWPEPSPGHANLLSPAHRAKHWPRGPSETFWSGVHRNQMIATADEVAEWLMLARDRAAHASSSLLEGSADVHAAGQLLARLADALAAWDKWRDERVIEDSARARRILAAAAFRWGSSVFMFRHFVAEHLDAGIARRLDEKEIAVLACAIQLRRRGRPKKNDELLRLLKQDHGLAPDEDVPDKIEALQRLAASVGVPRMSPDAVEDQVQPLLARMAEIRRWRDTAFAEFQQEDFESHEEARAAFEDADIQAAVMEDEAIRSCGTRKKGPAPSGKKPVRSRAVTNSRRGP